MEVISRQQAIAEGMPRYFTGVPCLSGHIAMRATTSAACCECQRQRSLKRRAGMSAEERAAEAQATKNRRCGKREQVRESYNLWRLKNLDAQRERGRKNEAKRRREKAAEVAASQRRYMEKNRDLMNARAAERRARKRNAKPSWFGELDTLVWREAAHLAKLREQATGFRWHADHMVPLASPAACGLHCASNCQVIPAAENMAKGARMQLSEPLEWIALL